MGEKKEGDWVLIPETPSDQIFSRCRTLEWGTEKDEKKRIGNYDANHPGRGKREKGDWSLSKKHYFSGHSDEKEGRSRHFLFFLGGASDKKREKQRRGKKMTRGMVVGSFRAMTMAQGGNRKMGKTDRLYRRSPGTEQRGKEKKRKEHEQH